MGSSFSTSIFATEGFGANLATALSSALTLTSLGNAVAVAIGAVNAFANTDGFLRLPNGDSSSESELDSGSMIIFAKGSESLLFSVVLCSAACNTVSCTASNRSASVLLLNGTSLSINIIHNKV